MRILTRCVLIFVNIFFKADEFCERLVGVLYPVLDVFIVACCGYV